MKMMESIIVKVLTTLYGHLGFSLTLAILFMFLYMYAKEHGWKNSLKQWWINLRKEREFQRVFLLAFWVAMIIFCTLFNRDVWMSPLSNVMGGWALHNKDGSLTTEAIENVILFTPLISLVFWNLHDKIFEQKFTVFKVILKSLVISFAFSLGIESCQLFFRLGTFQFSDLCYNTLGGLLGGLFYWCCYKIYRKRRNKNK